MEESQSGDEDGEKGSDTKADCFLQEENNAEEAEDEEDEEHEDDDEDEDEVEEDHEESGEDEEEDDEQHDVGEDYLGEDDVGEDDLEEHLQEGKAAATEEIVSKVKSFEFLRMFHHHHQFF